MTDAQFMNMTGYKKDAVRDSIKYLVNKQIITVDTKTVPVNGGAKKMRILRLRKNYRKAILKSSCCNTEKATDSIRKNNCDDTEKPQIKNNKNISEKINNNKNSHSVCLEEASSSKHIYSSTVRYY